MSGDDRHFEKHNRGWGQAESTVRGRPAFYAGWSANPVWWRDTIRMWSAWRRVWNGDLGGCVCWLLANGAIKRALRGEWAWSIPETAREVSLVRGKRWQQTEQGLASGNSHLGPNQTIPPPSRIPGENLHFTANISDKRFTGFATWRIWWWFVLYNWQS